MSRVWALLRKEALDMLQNRMVLGTLLVAPTILTLVSVGSLVPLKAVGEGEISQDDVAQLGRAVDCAGLDGQVCLQLSIASMHRLLFLIIPTVLPTAVAAYSVVGEKTERTLEALLATPVRTGELLFAKATAAVLPAVVATWLGASAHAAALGILLDPVVLGRLYDPAWLASLVVTAPLLAFASVFVSMMVSARSIDPRSAQQLGGLVVVPLVGLIVLQALGFGVLTPAVLGTLTVVLAGLDALLAWACVQLFDRETILTRWTGL